MEIGEECRLIGTAASCGQRRIFAGDMVVVEVRRFPACCCRRVGGMEKTGLGGARGWVCMENIT